MSITIQAAKGAQNPHIFRGFHRKTTPPLPTFSCNPMKHIWVTLRKHRKNP